MNRPIRVEGRADLRLSGLQSLELEEAIRQLYELAVEGSSPRAADKWYELVQSILDSATGWAKPDLVPRRGGV